MHSPLLTNDTADAILDGAIAPDDAPPGLRDVAVLIHAARPSTLQGPVALEDQVIIALAAGARIPAPVGSAVDPGRRRLLTKVVTGKVAVAAATLIFAGAAAAATTGALPSGIQSTVAHAASHLGVSLPDPGKRPQPHSLGQSTPKDGPGPAVGPNAFGLCTAYASVSKDFTSTNSPALRSSRAFAQLAAAAGAKRETVDQYCQLTHHGKSASGTSAETPGASHKPTHHGKPASTRQHPHVGGPGSSHQPTHHGKPASTRQHPHVGGPGSSHQPTHHGKPARRTNAETPGASHKPTQPGKAASAAQHRAEVPTGASHERSH
jgi:hypothetical protein